MPFPRRRTILFSALVGLAFSAGASTQSDPVFAHLDSNHDGRISLSEHGAAEKATFKRIDADHDGKLTALEISSARQTVMQGGVTAQSNDGAQAKNARPGSKGPTPTAEDAAVAQALFDRLDVDHDGTVSTAEMQAAHSRRPASAQAHPAGPGLGMIAMMDVNHDGFISATEHAAMAVARFARMDTNKDAFITGQEWAAAHASQPAKTP